MSPNGKSSPSIAPAKENPDGKPLIKAGDQTARPAHAVFLGVVLAAALMSVLILCLAPFPARADSQPKDDSPTQQEPPWTSALDFYRAFLSRADGHRCPMTPSCSHYAEQAFRRYGFVKGWILTCDRLLRCGRDESRLAPVVMSNGSAHVYDPLEANTFWWKRK